jgi:hypothetical protein
VGTVIQDTSQINQGSQPRWDRFERADLFEQYRELRTQGVSERQAAKALQVPRTTLQAWRQWHDTLDMCPHVAEFFQSGPGLAFLHRLVIAFHLACVEVGACGIRIVCLFLNLTELDRRSSRPEKLPALAPRRSGRARLRHPAPQNNRFATISARYARSSPRVADNTSGVPGTGPIEWRSSETVGLAICAISGSLRHEIGQDFDRLW